MILFCSLLIGSSQCPPMWRAWSFKQCLFVAGSSQSQACTNTLIPSWHVLFVTLVLWQPVTELKRKHTSTPCNCAGGPKRLAPPRPPPPRPPRPPPPRPLTPAAAWTPAGGPVAPPRPLPLPLPRELLSWWLLKPAPLVAAGPPNAAAPGAKVSTIRIHRTRTCNSED